MANLAWYATSKLKEKRLELGLTQEQMAEFLALNSKTSISASLYQKWEQREKPISPLMVIEIGRILETDWTRLFREKTA